MRLADRSTSLKTRQVRGPCRAKVKLPAEPVVIIYRQGWMRGVTVYSQKRNKTVKRPQRNLRADILQHIAVCCDALKALLFHYCSEDPACLCQKAIIIVEACIVQGCNILSGAQPDQCAGSLHQKVSEVFGSSDGIRQ